MSEMIRACDFRIAWVVPDMNRGLYIHPFLCELTKLFPQTRVFTGLWPGFSPGYENTFTVQVVGKTRFIPATRTLEGENPYFIYASPSIIRWLLRFRPHVVFVSAFSLWTLLVLLFKPWGGWRTIVVYSGSSPEVDARTSRLRSFARRLMARFTDAFITNSQAGKTYLAEVLRANETCIFARPYQIPTMKALSRGVGNDAHLDTHLKHPVFLFIGQIIPRKGVDLLLEACVILYKQGYHDYSLLVGGDGPQRQELELLSRSQGLEESVRWVGWIDYQHLGSYFCNADVFVFPTLDDIWGMVVLEAMIFGKPVLCSRWGGAAELITDGENGYVFDPREPEELAKLMRQFIDNPELIVSMGKRAKQVIAAHTPEGAAKFLGDVARSVYER